ncbi:MAG: alpha/beta hydrolase [Pirellulaceae bacterium]|nr:alpha/beta hydrolase [Pirellulaceae bacterium]
MNSFFGTMKTGRWLLGVVAVLILMFVAVCWLVGNALIAPAHRSVGLPPSDFPAVEVTFPSKSAASISAWYAPVDNAVATIVLLHPIRADRRSMLGRAKLLHDLGYSTLLVDLQSHGESIGDRIALGELERHDAVAAVEFVRSRNPKHRIGVVGRSLGGAAALLASPLDIDALVLESVYPDVTEAVHNRIEMRLGPFHYVLAPALLVQLKPRLGVSPSELRPVDHIVKADCPVLVAAGDQDLHTTLTESRTLFQAANEPKQFVVFADAAHDDLLEHNSHQYRNEIVPFLDLHLRSTEASD